MTDYLPFAPRSSRGHVLDEATAQAARSFLGRLKRDRLPIDAFVFGSRSRGDHHPDSDIDLAVVFEGIPGNRYSALRDLSDVAYDVLLETAMRVQALPLWTADFERPDLFSNPALIEHIKRDGIRP